LKNKKVEAKLEQPEVTVATIPSPAVTSSPVKLPKSLKIFSDNPAEPITIVFGSDRMGDGDPELGRDLLRNFLLAFDEMPKPPEAIILYNTAVRLVLPDSPVLAILRRLQDKRTEILVCATSLQHYAAATDLQVGEMRPMHLLAERMMQAHHILWP
jgi:hypothetical protein